MNPKKMLIVLLVLLMGLQTAAFADGTVEIVPISATLPETLETLGGYMISYENQTLSLRVEGFEYPVTAYDRDGTHAKDLTRVRPLDYVEIAVSRGEATYYLEGVLSVSPRMDSVVTREGSGVYELTLDGMPLETDCEVQRIDGVLMIPLRTVAESLGYEVSWDQDTQGVEVSKGAQWTRIILGNNAYFFARMAPKPLSHAPVAVEGRTLVPLEFITEILGVGLQVEQGEIRILKEETMAIHTGYLQEIRYDETGMMTLILADQPEEVPFEQTLVVHTASAYTVFQKDIQEGDLLTVITPPIMTMSLPGQTSAVVVY